MPCQWSTITTLFSTTQSSKNPSKQPMPCSSPRNGSVASSYSMMTLPRRTTPRTTPVPTPPEPLVQDWNPSSWLSFVATQFFTVLYSNVQKSARPRRPSPLNVSIRFDWIRFCVPGRSTEIPKSMLRNTFRRTMFREPDMETASQGRLFQLSLVQPWASFTEYPRQSSMMMSEAPDMLIRVSAVYVGAVSGEISSPCTCQKRAELPNDSFFSVAFAPLCGRMMTKPELAFVMLGLPWCPAIRMSTSPDANVFVDAATACRFGNGDACVPGLVR